MTIIERTYGKIELSQLNMTRLAKFKYKTHSCFIITIASGLFYLLYSLSEKICKYATPKGKCSPNLLGNFI